MLCCHRLKVNENKLITKVYFSWKLLQIENILKNIVCKSYGLLLYDIYIFHKFCCLENTFSPFLWIRNAIRGNDDRICIYIDYSLQKCCYISYKPMFNMGCVWRHIRQILLCIYTQVRMSDLRVMFALSCHDQKLQRDDWRRPSWVFCRREGPLSGTLKTPELNRRRHPKFKGFPENGLFRFSEQTCRLAVDFYTHSTFVCHVYFPSDPLSCLFSSTCSCCLKRVSIKFRQSWLQSAGVN